MRPSLSKKEEKTLYWIGIGIVSVSLVTAVLFKVTGLYLPALMPDCLFLGLTGLYCPGCGGTRAITYLYQGHLLRSFIYHPVVLYTAVFGGWYLISHTVELISHGKAAIGMRYRDIYLYAAAAIILLNWLVKNFFILRYGLYLLSG